MLATLAEDVKGGASVVWKVVELDYGSAILVVKPIGPDDTPDNLVEKISEIAGYYRRGDISSLRQSEIKAMCDLSKFGKHISEISIVTSTIDFVIGGLLDDIRPQANTSIVTWGTVKGRVQSMSNRRMLRFTLYDALFDKAANCFIDESQVNMLTDIWDRDVFVTGRVTQHAKTGRPLSVRNITAVTKVPDVAPGDYFKAYGLFVSDGHEEPAEITIRRLRDGEE